MIVRNLMTVLISFLKFEKICLIVRTLFKELIVDRSICVIYWSVFVTLSSFICLGQVTKCRKLISTTPLMYLFIQILLETPNFPTIISVRDKL